MRLLGRRESALSLLFVAGKPKAGGPYRLSFGVERAGKVRSEHRATTSGGAGRQTRNPVSLPAVAVARALQPRPQPRWIEPGAGLPSLTRRLQRPPPAWAPAKNSLSTRGGFAAPATTAPTAGTRPRPDDEDDKMVAGEEIAHSKGEKQVAVRACGRLYQDLVRRRPVLYYGAPAGSGILFDVKYYDSVDAVPAGAPVVCLLHGAPGSYQDFSSLINSLTQRGLRVVAPNFPDYNATYQHGFRHSPRERLDFLLEFFKAVQVDAIDMLIGHSASVYTLFELLEYSLAEDVSRWRTSSGDFKPAIRSVGLFSTPSYKLPRNLAVTPLRLFTLKLFDYRIMRPLILACIGWWVRIQGIKNRVDVDKIEDFLMAASTVGYSEYGKLRDRLHLLGQFRIPALLVYGKRDRLIPARVFASLEASLVGGGGARVKSYDEHGEQVGAPAPAETAPAPVDVCRFEEGGHYVFQRYASQVNGDVLDFLQRRVLQRGQAAMRL